MIKFRLSMCKLMGVEIPKHNDQRWEIPKTMMFKKGKFCYEKRRKLSRLTPSRISRNESECSILPTPPRNLHFCLNSLHKLCICWCLRTITVNFIENVDKELLLMTLGCLTEVKVLKFDFRNHHLEGLSVMYSEFNSGFSFLPPFIKSCLPCGKVFFSLFIKKFLLLFN